MTQAERFRAKMLRGFVRALADEPAHLARCRRLSNLCAFVGAVALTLAIFIGWGADVLFVIAGTVAGLLFGFALFFHTAADQWPVTREFLKVEEVREAARRLEA